MADPQYRIPVLEAFPWQETVLSRKLTTPPVSPSKGDRFLIPSEVEPTSSWNGRENQIAWFDGLNWHYDPPFPGWVLYVTDEDIHVRFTGQAWIPNYIDNSSGLTYRMIYVSAYAEDGGTGSVSRPFNSINDAVESIIAAGDNDDYPYVIYIGAGSYPEMVVLESNKLFNLYFIGTGSRSTIIDACCGKSLRSMIRNDCLETLVFRHIGFKDPIYLEGHIHQSKLGNTLVFDECLFDENSDIILKNVAHPTFTGLTEINGNFYISNVSCCKISSEIQIKYKQNEKDFIIETDPTVNFPDSWMGKTQLYLSGNLERYIDWRLHNGGEAYIQLRMGGQYGLLGDDFFVPQRSILEAVNSRLLGNFTYNGNLILDSSFVSGRLIAGTGHVDFRNQPASQIFNDSNVPGTSVTDALNVLYSSINSGTGISGSIGGTGGTGGTGSSGIAGTIGGTGGTGGVGLGLPGLPGATGGTGASGASGASGAAGSAGFGSLAYYDVLAQELFIEPSLIVT